MNLVILYLGCGAIAWQDSPDVPTSADCRACGKQCRVTASMTTLARRRDGTVPGDL